MGSTAPVQVAMKAAKSELKATIKHDVKIDDVNNFADDMADLIYEFQEINEKLAQNLPTKGDIDEVNLDDKLNMPEDELEEELVEYDAQSVPSYLRSPLLALPTAAPGLKVPPACRELTVTVFFCRCLDLCRLDYQEVKRHFMSTSMISAMAAEKAGHNSYEYDFLDTN
ncbi:hypothetical protein HJC23_008312 [Cyclotella cryptica]|uniref:Uncharacterized protein n=1 Tax=Cyclotella cryptica TaxID=29204 RepID=A0ABD3Q589_9STRA|eukprot:CCRYP_008577-RA/>CCRYP_008577-RA protein AED:0.45 eAED:0.45 QI:0/-1/0/1/-1/1/1/0/168